MKGEGPKTLAENSRSGVLQLSTLGNQEGSITSTGKEASHIGGDPGERSREVKRCKLRGGMKIAESLRNHSTVHLFRGCPA